MRRNSIHRYPPELKSAIRVISKLKRTIQEVEHENKIEDLRNHLFATIEGLLDEENLWTSNARKRWLMWVR